MKLVTKEERKFLDNSTLATSGGTLPSLGTIVSANKSATQAASTVGDITSLTNDFNALLVKLKAAGIML